MQPTVSVQKAAWACVVPFPLTGTSAPLEPAGDVVMGRKPEECCAAPSAAAEAYSTVPAQARTRAACLACKACTADSDAEGKFAKGSSALRRNAASLPQSHGDLGADLHHPARRNLEKVGGFVGGAREADEQPVLQPFQPIARLGLERAARQEERRLHDVELPAELAGDGEGLGHVRRLHEAELEPHLHE